MAKLIIVIGLPGSGKSHHLKKLRDTGAVEWICEDFHADAYNNSRRVVDSRYFKPLISNLREEISCAVADIAFCDPMRRGEFEEEVRAQAPAAEIEFQCFENDKNQCAKNAEQRARETLANELGLINEFSSRYQFPPGAQILPVYREATDQLL